jgi:hypothetical protein
VEGKDEGLLVQAFSTPLHIYCQKGLSENKYLFGMKLVVNGVFLNIILQ